MKIGDEVLCINGYMDDDMHLETGKEYVILDIDICCNKTIDVGLTIAGSFGTTCQKCGHDCPLQQLFHRSDRFVLKKELEEHDEAVEELVEKLIKACPKPCHEDDEW